MTTTLPINKDELEDILSNDIDIRDLLTICLFGSGSENEPCAAEEMVAALTGADTGEGERVLAENIKAVDFTFLPENRSGSFVLLYPAAGLEQQTEVRFVLDADQSAILCEIV